MVGAFTRQTRQAVMTSRAGPSLAGAAPFCNVIVEKSNGSISMDGKSAVTARWPSVQSIGVPPDRHAARIVSELTTLLIAEQVNDGFRLADT